MHLADRLSRSASHGILLDDICSDDIRTELIRTAVCIADVRRDPHRLLASHTIP